MGSTVTTQVVKKVRVKEVHAEAIAAYKVWLKKHPGSSKLMRVQQFDYLVDTAELKLLIEDDGS